MKRAKFKYLKLNKKAMSAILEPLAYYRYAMIHLDDLVWLLEPEQNKIDPISFKQEVRSLVKQMVKERKAARTASERLDKLLKKTMLG